LTTTQAISNWAKSQELQMHLDGARLWNAIVATGVAGPRWAACFDSLSVCFSKGLGAPVGSALVGNRDFIARARRVRKLFGGGMRQAGILAAAALHAMDQHMDRLAEDHANAQILAQAIAATPGLRLVPAEVETNLVWFEVDPTLGTARDVEAKLASHGVRVAALGAQVIRACTHLDVSTTQVKRASEVISRVLR
jgi:threonine aldolase